MQRRTFLATPMAAASMAAAAAPADQRVYAYGDGIPHTPAEYSRLLDAYASLGYEILMLPKANVDERADFVLKMLSG